VSEQRSGTVSERIAKEVPVILASHFDCQPEDIEIDRVLEQSIIERVVPDIEYFFCVIIDEDEIDNVISVGDLIALADKTVNSALA